MYYMHLHACALGFIGAKCHVYNSASIRSKNTQHRVVLELQKYVLYIESFHPLRQQVPTIIQGLKFELDALICECQM